MALGASIVTLDDLHVSGIDFGCGVVIPATECQGNEKSMDASPKVEPTMMALVGSSSAVLFSLSLVFSCCFHEAF